MLEDYEGLYPLGNLVAPENQLAEIPTNRVSIGQKSGKTSI